MNFLFSTTFPCVFLLLSGYLLVLGSGCVVMFIFLVANMSACLLILIMHDNVSYVNRIFCTQCL